MKEFSVSFLLLEIAMVPFECVARIMSAVESIPERIRRLHLRPLDTVSVRSASRQIMMPPHHPAAYMDVLPSLGTDESDAA